ncbi:hypothetical protein BI364_17040 [Acidihalobacter yilgarnensis]|uniref:FTP domain-containing protein n=1 Tax=Acidihalobacter yilgarnensis TaxID=2819280 RepID=A0A1D8ISL4_9GAMM|nr:hypothetical protein [Acidihalobacter yilgarnensis]AOU99403.1 hypothetical protein BI364_17040 [Acidihalobacter yilgarnensis]
MKRYVYLSYALLGVAVAGMTVAAKPLISETHHNGVLQAEYSLADHAHLTMGIDSKHVTNASIDYGKSGIFGQKSVGYWIGHGKLISRFAAAGETETRGQVVNATRDPGLNVVASTIRVTPTHTQVNIAGHMGQVYHLRARINGQMHTWDAVLAKGGEMHRLNKAWSRLIAQLGPIQSSEEVATTMLAINLHPELYGYAPLKVGNTVELRRLRTDLSVARIYAPKTMNMSTEG